MWQILWICVSAAGPCNHGAALKDANFKFDDEKRCEAFVQLVLGGDAYRHVPAWGTKPYKPTCRLKLPVTS